MEAIVAVQAIEDFKRATENMSLPLMLALLARIHERLSEEPGHAEVADRVEQVINLLLEADMEVAGSTPEAFMPRSRRHH